MEKKRLVRRRRLEEYGARSTPGLCGDAPPACGGAPALGQANGGGVKLAPARGSVAQHQGELFAGLLRAAAEGDVGEIALAAAGAAQPPEGGGNIVDQLDFERADGLGFVH